MKIIFSYLKENIICHESQNYSNWLCSNLQDNWKKEAGIPERHITLIPTIMFAIKLYLIRVQFCSPFKPPTIKPDQDDIHIYMYVCIYIYTCHSSYRCEVHKIKIWAWHESTEKLQAYMNFLETAFTNTISKVVKVILLSW